jgi:hypothetical protein
MLKLIIFKLTLFEINIFVLQNIIKLEVAKFVQLVLAQK